MSPGYFTRLSFDANLLTHAVELLCSRSMLIWKWMLRIIYSL